jgi:hypothetical protein
MCVTVRQAGECLEGPVSLPSSCHCKVLEADLGLHFLGDVLDPFYITHTHPWTKVDRLFRKTSILHLYIIKLSAPSKPDIFSMCTHPL